MGDVEGKSLATVIFHMGINGLRKEAILPCFSPLEKGGIRELVDSVSLGINLTSAGQRVCDSSIDVAGNGDPLVVH